LGSSADFRNIAAPGNPGRPERLFRAAIHAFCCIPRPSRREIVQLDDLAVPLLADVSPGARRFAAAALSECAHVPPELVRRLCDDRPEIAAPLLIRSAAIGDVDLIALIGRHGLGHARVIARRKDLKPPIAALIRALESASRTRTALDEPEHEVDRIRRELRAMMGAAQDAEPVGADTAVADRSQALVRAALSGSFAAISLELGRSLDVSEDKARLLVSQASLADLPLALRALGVSDERAFLIVACVRPVRFATVRSVRAFVEDYRALDAAECRSAVAEWRTTIAGEEAPRTPANADIVSIGLKVS
jgi:uncharacterized protein (DUF2336 family)